MTRRYLAWILFLAATIPIGQHAIARVDGNRWDDGREHRQREEWRQKRIAEVTPKLIAFEAQYVVVMPPVHSFIESENEKRGFALAAKLTIVLRELGFRALTFKNCVSLWMRTPMWQERNAEMEMTYVCLPWHLLDGLYAEPTPDVIDLFVNAAEHLERP